MGPSPTDAALAADLALPIEDLDPTVRSYNCLKREGHSHRRRFRLRSEADLLDIRNFGTKSIDEVKAKLHGMGLSLRTARPGSTPVPRPDGYDDFDEDDEFRPSPRTSSSDDLHHWEIDMPSPRGPRLGGGPRTKAAHLANLATALFEHDAITTTEAKAKRLRPLAERLITFAKRVTCTPAAES